MIERPKALIRDKLLHKKYSLTAIKDAMGNHFPAEDNELSVIKDYKKLANPKLVTSSQVNNSEKIDSDKIQLYIIEDFLKENLCQELVELSKIYCKPSKNKGGYKVNNLDEFHE